MLNLDLCALSVENRKVVVTNMAYTLAMRRTHHPWRIELLAESISNLTMPIVPVARQKTLRNARIGYVFTGRGVQFAQMGIGLMIYGTFRESLRRYQMTLGCFGCTWNLTGMFSLQLISCVNSLRMSFLTLWISQKAEYSQALITALQIALVDLLESFGIKPVSVICHSSGEINFCSVSSLRCRK
jgi:acyl transferase domain-containing protein